MKHNRVVIESGRKKVFASAVDWPGWTRSGTSEEDALFALAEYANRYQDVAERAGARGVISAASGFDVIEHISGTATTDFGVPDKPAKAEDVLWTPSELERQIKLLRACWEHFDHVSARVSEELRKGPRGGGRNRTKVVEHTLEAERNYARQIGVKTPPHGMDSSDGLKQHREGVCDAVRQIHAEGGETGKSWPLAYFVRRAAWHVLDHTWEMEDKDLTGEES